MQELTLGEVAEYINGRAFKPDEWEESGKPIIRIQNLTQTSSECNRTTGEYDEKYLVKDGDLLFAWSASLGAHIWHGEDGWLNQHIFKVVPNEKVIQKYLYYYLLFVVNELYSKTHGTGMVHITLKPFKQTKIPVYSLNEQQCIVERIESLFTKLDAAKEHVQDVLSSYQNRKSMIIHNAFAGKYTKTWRERNGLDIAEWESLTLNDVAEYKKGPFGSSITKAMFVPKSSNTYKVYEQGNAIRKTIDYGSYYITEEKYNELKGFSIQSGDIIISCAGTIGEVYKLPEGCEAGVINQALMRVRIFDNIDERFFIYYFGEVLKGDVNEQANGTAIKNIPPFKIMKAMEIKLPTLAEQQEIVTLLDKVLESEKQSEEALNLIIDQIDLMKKSVLAKAFRGEFDISNPD